MIINKKFRPPSTPTPGVFKPGRAKCLQKSEYPGATLEHALQAFLITHFTGPLDAGKTVPFRVEQWPGGLRLHFWAPFGLQKLPRMVGNRDLSPNNISQIRERTLENRFFELFCQNFKGQLNAHWQPFFIRSNESKDKNGQWITHGFEISFETGHQKHPTAPNLQMAHRNFFNSIIDPKFFKGIGTTLSFLLPQTTITTEDIQLETTHQGLRLIFPVSVFDEIFLEALGWDPSQTLVRTDEKHLRDLARSFFHTRAYIEIMKVISRNLSREDFQPDFSVEIICSAIRGDWLKTGLFTLGMEVSTNSYTSPRKNKLQDDMLDFRPSH